jgi:hypothetical protein
MNDGRNSIRLERILEIQGCLRINRDYHVPVLINAADWGHRIRFSETANERLPELVVPLDTVLRAMNHESLISAARKWLSPQNRWWVVDVYVEDQGRCHRDFRHLTAAPGAPKPPLCCWLTMSRTGKRGDQCGSSRTAPTRCTSGPVSARTVSERATAA